MLSKLDSKGKILWTKTFGDSLDEVGFSVEVDPNGDLFIGGMTNGNLNGIQNNGDYDVFLMKLDSDGKEIWTMRPIDRD